VQAEFSVCLGSRGSTPLLARIQLAGDSRSLRAQGEHECAESEQEQTPGLGGGRGARPAPHGDDWGGQVLRARAIQGKARRPPANAFVVVIAKDNEEPTVNS